MSDRDTDEEPEPLPHDAGVPVEVAPPAGAPTDEPAPDGAARPSVAGRTTGWREELVGSAGATAVVGVWLVLSPEALGYGPGDATWNPVACGVLVVVFSLARLFGPWRMRALGVVLFAVGAWLAASSFLFDAPIGGQWNQALMGGIVAVVSLIGLAASQRGQELNQG